MARWEVCTIKLVRAKSPNLFSNAKMVWQAVADTPQGPQVIDQTTEEFDALKRDGEFSRAEYSKLVGRLLASGWEPIGTNRDGSVETLRRQVP